MGDGWIDVLTSILGRALVKAGSTGLQRSMMGLNHGPPSARLRGKVDVESRRLFVGGR